MPEAFDPGAMVARFRERAAAVRRRGMPPVEGAERRRIIEQMELDYMDFAMVGDAAAELAEGILTLTIDLRPSSATAARPMTSPSNGPESPKGVDGRR